VGLGKQAFADRTAEHNACQGVQYHVPLSVRVGNARLLVCRENNCPQCRMPMQSRRDCKKVHHLAGKLSFMESLARSLVMLFITHKMQSMFAQDFHRQLHTICMRLTHLS